MITLVDIWLAVPFSEQKSVSFSCFCRRPEAIICPLSLPRASNRREHAAGTKRDDIMERPGEKLKHVRERLETYLPRRREGQPATRPAARRRRICNRAQPSGRYRKQGYGSHHFSSVLAVRDLPLEPRRGFGMVRGPGRTAGGGVTANPSQRNRRRRIRSRRKGHRAATRRPRNRFEFDYVSQSYCQTLGKDGPWLPTARICGSIVTVLSASRTGRCTRCCVLVRWC